MSRREVLKKPSVVIRLDLHKFRQAGATCARSESSHCTSSWLASGRPGAGTFFVLPKQNSN